ncbi:hypothetical protein [Streptacidiphilus neutrinimicus]|uniref:hypothetical protein n=1 Tax=Streptacidiphilus neutrinimicus TaxID=105420 RepID=UPI000694CE38|nr:hypothetical protein [Streptacidiphilus neutrinimicus]
MGYTFTGERQVRAFECGCCRTQADRTWAYLDRDGEPCAVFFASCYHHQGSPEIYFDVILGTWGTDDQSDHVTFGARYGAVQGQREPACSLVTGGAVAPDSAIYGTKLDREGALAHPRLAEFWQIVDFLIEHDPVVSDFIAAH